MLLSASQASTPQQHPEFNLNKTMRLFEVPIFFKKKANKPILIISSHLVIIRYWDTDLLFFPPKTIKFICNENLPCKRSLHTQICIKVSNNNFSHLQHSKLSLQIDTFSREQFVHLTCFLPLLGNVYLATSHHILLEVTSHAV